MSTEEGGAPLAHDVSDAFVKQYFIVLEQMPHEARKFYVDDSVVSRPGPDGTLFSFTSVEAINEHFVTGDYENATFELLTVDSQNSFEDGIFIMVIGFVTGKDNVKRKFSQMFYLARQKSAYVVLNDIFRYIDEDVSDSVTVPIVVVESLPETETVKPVDEIKKNEETEKSVTVAEVKEVVVEAVGPTPLNNGKIKNSEEKVVVTDQKPKEPVAEKAADGAKRSFADIVQSMAKNAAPFQAKTIVQKPKYSGQGQPRVAAAPRAPAPVVSNFEKKNVPKIVEEPGTSIFVANLPMNATPPQLHDLFKDFGPIRENGIQVRSTRQATGICFGFVAFESVNSVQNVLEAAKNNPFVLADRKLRVKEKQVDYDGNKPSGRSGGGSKTTQNGSTAATDGGEEFKRSRNRRNGGGRNERRGDGNANGDNNNNNQRNNEGGAIEVQK